MENSVYLYKNTNYYEKTNIGTRSFENEEDDGF